MEKLESKHSTEHYESSAVFPVKKAQIWVADREAVPEVQVR